MVVELLKVQKKVITLAIGDGANDVGMIKGQYHSITVSQYHSITVSQYHSITVSQS